MTDDGDVDDGDDDDDDDDDNDDEVDATKTEFKYICDMKSWKNEFPLPTKTFLPLLPRAIYFSYATVRYETCQMRQRSDHQLDQPAIILRTQNSELGTWNLFVLSLALVVCCEALIKF